VRRKRHDGAKASVTQLDIARRAGVSQASVSAVLSDNLQNIRISPALQKKIRRVAALTGYRINSGARAMRTRRFHNLGYFVAVRTLPEIDYPDFRAGVYDGAVAGNYHVTLIRLPKPTATEPNPIPKAFREAHLDALIVNQMTGITPALKKVIAASRLPVVYLNEKFPTNTVAVDDFAGAQVLTEHLLAQGYRRIAQVSYADFQTRHYSGPERRQGYTAAMAAHGLSPLYQTVSRDPTGAEVIQWLRSAKRPEAIFCYNDPLALQMQGWAMQAGLRIPDDLGLAGYGVDGCDDYFLRRLTTMAIPRHAMGVAAVNMALTMLDDGAPQSVKSIVMPATLRPGNSIQMGES